MEETKSQTPSEAEILQCQKNELSNQDSSVGSMLDWYAGGQLVCIPARDKESTQFTLKMAA